MPDPCRNLVFMCDFRRRADNGIACGKGTYLSALAKDLGATLGSGAHVAGLRRTASGFFTLDRAVTLEALEAAEAPARDALLLPVDAPPAAMPRLDIAADAARALWQGAPSSIRRRRRAAIDAMRRCGYSG